MPDNVVIRNNVLIDSALSPVVRTVEVKTMGAPVRNLEVSGNVLCNSGREALYVDWAENLQVRKNIFINPWTGRSLWSGREATPRPPAAIVLERIRGARISENVLVPNSRDSILLQKTDAEMASEEENREVKDVDNELEKTVLELTQRHDQSVSAMLEKIWDTLRRNGSSRPKPRE